MSRRVRFGRVNEGASLMSQSMGDIVNVEINGRIFKRAIVRHDNSDYWHVNELSAIMDLFLVVPADTKNLGTMKRSIKRCLRK